MQKSIYALDIISSLCTHCGVTKHAELYFNKVFGLCAPLRWITESAVCTVMYLLDSLITNTLLPAELHFICDWCCSFRSSLICAHKLVLNGKSNREHQRNLICLPHEGGYKRRQHSLLCLLSPPDVKAAGILSPNEQLLLRILKKQFIRSQLQSWPAHHYYRRIMILMFRANHFICLNSDISFYTTKLSLLYTW